MSLLSVVRDVCAVVGVEQPTSVFSSISSNRTMAEMLTHANEMAKRIAYDTREWMELKTETVFTGDSVTVKFPMPSNYKRMLLTSEVWRSSTPQEPMRFISDQGEFTRRRQMGWTDPRGEWIFAQGRMWIVPTLSAPRNTLPVWKNNYPYAVDMKACDAVSNTASWQVVVAHTSAAAGTFAADRAANPSYWTSITPVMTPVETARFIHLDKNCINISTGGVGDSFITDNDTFRLDERLLKLGMIWQWKASKGSPYAEDMANYATALDMVAGADKPAPIIIGRTPISANARVAFPWPSHWGP
jgi:hypothetical protein